VTKTQAVLFQSLRASLGPELASFGTSPEAMADMASRVSAGADALAPGD